MAVLVDTGVLYALADADDAWHDRAVEWLDGERDVLAAPVTVLPEVCSLLAARLGRRQERQFVESVGKGEIAVEPLVRADLTRAAVLLRKYPRSASWTLRSSPWPSVSASPASRRRTGGTSRRYGRRTCRGSISCRDERPACLPSTGCGTFRGRGTRRERE